MGDRELVKSLKKGDEEAYIELLNTYGNKLLKTCFLMIKDESEAEDIAQETFLKVFKYIKGFKGDSSIYTWIYKIAQNTIRDKYRNKITTIPYEDYTISNENIEEIIINRENRKVLKGELDKINFIYKEVLVLFYFDEFSIKEISGILDEKEGTIKSKLSRGRKILGERLEKGGKFNGL